MQFKVKNTTFVIESCESRQINIKKELFKRIEQLKKLLGKEPRQYIFKTVDEFLAYRKYEQDQKANKFIYENK